MHLRLGFRGDDDDPDRSTHRKESRSPSILVASDDDLDLSEEEDYQVITRASSYLILYYVSYVLMKLYEC